MKKYIIFGLIPLILMTTTVATFEDITDNPYENDITQMAEQGVVEGFPGNLFNPDRAITRAEILKIVMEAAQIPIQQTQEACFKDVPVNKRYSDYICTAVKEGIVKGYDDGSFRPENPVLFSEGIKIGIEGFGIQTLATEEDDPRYQGYLNFVHNNTIFSKFAIYPENKMTRAQMTHLAAAIINHNNNTRNNQRDNRSLGCQNPKPGMVSNSIVVGNIERHFIVDIGSHYNQNKPSKLILAFHGRTNANDMVRSYYKVDQAGDGNTIFIYPLALPEEGPSRSRQDPGDSRTALRDYALFDNIVQEFTNKYCIDLDQIYVIGHSLGAIFANNLACARGNIIRAVGSVGGDMLIKATQCSGPVSAIIMHNPDDNLASFAGGERARNTLVAQNQCNPDNYTQLDQLPDGGTCIQYNSCLEGSSVTRCETKDSQELGGYHPHKRPNYAGKLIRNFFNTL